MSTIRLLAAASLPLALVLTACNDPATPSVSPRVDGSTPGVHRQYGTPTKVGNGMVRTYIVLDQKNNGVPLEIGVAMSEGALEGLPAGMPMGGGDGQPPMNMSMYLLDLPAQNPTSYKFVQFDWNPQGHEPAGVYDLPHFDFHFYTVPVSVRNSIVPTDPAYATKAANFPDQAFRAPFYVDAATAGGITPALASVPQMGLHWLDVRSPELQKLAGHPEAYKPFTTTFIYGSWDGQFIFDEPMITRAYILSKRAATTEAGRDEIIPVPVPERYAPAGYYPRAYRITYDAQAKEYRIALTQLVKQG